MIFSALVTVSLWHVSGYDDDLLKIVPGTAVAALIYAASFLVARSR